MDPLRCDVCGEPAAIYETVLEGDRAVARHLCQEHGEATWRAAVPLDNPRLLGASPQNVEEYVRSLSEEERKQLAELYRMTRRLR